MNSELRIMAARDGGYIVFTDAAEHIKNQAIFAGGMSETLEFVAKFFGGRVTTESGLAKDLCLSVRSAQIVRTLGVTSVDELCSLTEAELLRTPNCGRRTINELKEVLAGMGRHLGTAR